MVRMKVVCLAGALAFAAGCANLELRKPVNAGQIKSLQPGRTTRDEAIGILGQPYKILNADGREVLFYPDFSGDGKAGEFYVTIENNVVSTYTNR